MKKITIVLLLVIVVGGYLLFKSGSNNSTNANNSTTDTLGASENNTSQNSQNNSATTSYKDGTYDGDTIDAFYGMVQVEAVISEGKITDIKFLQFPDSPGHTSEVSSQALPALKTEAIQKQSAPVDVIGGATQTSDGFNKSLASALQKAQ
ncbi:MAG TPA: FMN-binding protein [Patescibacteria group bacterium]